MCRLPSVSTTSRGWCRLLVLAECRVRVRRGDAGPAVDAGGPEMLNRLTCA